MPETLKTLGKVKTAVVTGRHPFDVPSFHEALRNMPEVDAYPQHLEDFAADAGKVRDSYGVVVFYNMHMETPTSEGPWYDRSARIALEKLGETDQGIVVLHHAVLAYPKWGLWNDLVGIQDRSFGYHMNQEVRVHVANPDHPITEGLADFSLVDETYTMASAGEGSDVLLTVDHKLSMATIGWTRRFRNARVFCFQSGHDRLAFADPNFRTILSRGIHWAVGRI
jgi:type 1 glutamine amidotransferase